MNQLNLNIVAPESEPSIRTLNGVVSGLMCEALEAIEVTDTGLTLTFGLTDDLDKYVSLLMLEHSMAGAKAPILLMSYLAQVSGEIQIEANNETISLSDFAIVYDEGRDYTMYDTDTVFHITGTLGTSEIRDVEADNIRKVIIQAVQAKDDAGLTTLLTRQKEKPKAKSKTVPKVKQYDKAKAKAKRKTAKTSKRKNRG